jgi:hypothetical protein
MNWTGSKLDENVKERQILESDKKVGSEWDEKREDEEGVIHKHFISGTTHWRSSAKRLPNLFKVPESPRLP